MKMTEWVLMDHTAGFSVTACPVLMILVRAREVVATSEGPGLPLPRERLQSHVGLSRSYLLDAEEPSRAFHEKARGLA